MEGSSLIRPTKRGWTIMGFVSSVALALVPSTANSQSPNEMKTATFSLLRTFQLPNIPSEDLQSELFRKADGDVEMADIVDLNLEFSKIHGKPEVMPPEFAPRTHTIILKFPDGWWTTSMVRADGKGSFLCRVKMHFFEPKPDQNQVGKFIDWCHASLTLATLDPEILTNSPRPVN